MFSVRFPACYSPLSVTLKLSYHKGIKKPKNKKVPPPDGWVHFSSNDGTKVHDDDLKLTCRGLDNHARNKRLDGDPAPGRPWVRPAPSVHPSIRPRFLPLLYEGGMIARCHICWHAAIKP